MPVYPRLRVFVSSKMTEPAEERMTIKTALDSLYVDAWVFEKDQGARPEGARQAYLEEVEASDLYVGIFWCNLGDSTKEEYEHAVELGRDCP